MGAEPSCDPAVFGDPELEMAVREALGVPDGPLTAAAMDSLRELEARRVATLDGLECASNLESLGMDTAYGVAVDLGPLRGLSRLRTLELVGKGLENQILDLSPIAGVAALERLRFLWVELADLEPLSGLDNLAELELFSCKVADLSALAEVTPLLTLEISDTHVEDLEPLSTLTNLRDLELVGDGVSDLGPLSGLTNVERLDLKRNAIVDLGPLAAMTRLEELTITGNPVTDLAPLAELPALIHLEAQAAHVEDVAPLAEFPQLGFVDLRDNRIVDLSPLVGATWDLPLGCADLGVNGNPLSEESMSVYGPQICVDSGIFIPQYCTQCSNSCLPPNPEGLCE